MDAIKTSGLTKMYGRKRAVDSIDLTVQRGEIYGFVGSNGSGKSTVMKLISGLILPTAGEVEVLGERLEPGHSSRRVGALIESPGLYPDLSGFDNVMCRALALGVPHARRVSLELLDLVGLKGHEKKRTKTYSLGMKQRLGLALALVGSPDLLLLDEPFNGLDPRGVREVRNLIVRLARQRNITVFISSHVLDQLERMVTHYGVIREGGLVCEMSADAVEEACVDHLEIRCDNPQVALAVLGEAFPTGRFSIKADDSICAEGDIRVEQVGAVLADAGLAVFGLQRHERDIEDLFINLMNEEALAGDERA